MRSKLILLIDDDYIDVENMKRELAKLKVKTTLSVFHNGVAALEYLISAKSTVPDAIILDINMPKMNGFEFLKIIKSYHNFKKIPVYIVSTSSEEYDRITAKHLGVDGYIVKPLSLDAAARPESDSQKLRKALEGG